VGGSCIQGSAQHGAQAGGRVELQSCGAMHGSGDAVELQCSGIATES
jgi:hypothetical protein